MNIKQKTTQRLDELQQLLETNTHLKDGEAQSYAYNLTLEISKCWSILSEEDREYVQCAQDAIEERLEWNI